MGPDPSVWSERWEFDVIELPTGYSGFAVAMCVTAALPPRTLFAEGISTENAAEEAVRHLACAVGLDTATVVVRDDALAAEVARLAPAVHVVREARLAVLDRIADANIDDLFMILARTAMHSVLDQRPKLLRAVFEAARSFFLARPWMVVPDTATFHLTIGSGTLHATVRGADRALVGLSMFGEAPQDPGVLEDADDPIDATWLALWFLPEKQVPPSLREQRLRHRLRIVGQSFPVVQPFADRAPRAADAELLLIALLAVNRFTARHVNALARGDWCTGTETIRPGGGRRVDVSIEYRPGSPPPDSMSETFEGAATPSPQSAPAEQQTSGPSPQRRRPPSLALHPRVLLLYIELDDVEPPIWRRIEVPAAITLRALHDIIQLVMGWTDSHLHVFEIDAVRYGFGDNEDDEDERDDAHVLLGDVVTRPHTGFRYDYDYGDDWRHRVIVEQIRRDVRSADVPRLLDGGGACPPEDCGGMAAYYRMVDAIAHPNHPDPGALLRSVGEQYDPAHYDVAAHDRLLARLRRRGTRGSKAAEPRPAPPGALARWRADMDDGSWFWNALGELSDRLTGYPPQIFETAGNLLMRHARATAAHPAERKSGVWFAAALHAACMLHARALPPLPRPSVAALARMFGVSRTAVAKRNAELRRAFPAASET